METIIGPLLIIIGLLMLLGLVAFKYFAFPVPAKQYGIFNLFGKRWRARSEGLTWKVPHFEGCQFYTKELQRKEVMAIAKSKDLLGIKLEGSVEYVADPDSKMLLKYDETKEQQAKALEDSIKDELGVLTGTKRARDFVHERKAITLIINCLLRLKEMPHKDPSQLGDQRTVIRLGERLDFYQNYADKIQEILDHETEKPEERSRIEEAYGIDILVFNLTDPDYTDKTNAAFEEAEQSKAKLAAAENELKLVDRFKEKGASSQEAIDAAQVSLGKATKQVHSIIGKPIEIKLGGGDGH